MILDTKLNPRSDDFRTAADHMRALVADLKAKVAQVAEGAARPRAPSTWRAASSCRANG